MEQVCLWEELFPAPTAISWALVPRATDRRLTLDGETHNLGRDIALAVAHLDGEVTAIELRDRRGERDGKDSITDKRAQLREVEARPSTAQRDVRGHRQATDVDAGIAVGHADANLRQRLPVFVGTRPADGQRRAKIVEKPPIPRIPVVARDIDGAAQIDPAHKSKLVLAAERRHAAPGRRLIVEHEVAGRR